MKAIILAAGKGTRLMPFTTNKPKCLVSINNKCLIDHQINVLKSRNIKDITIVTGYLGYQLTGKGRIIMNKNYEETNMIYSLHCAIDEIRGETLITYGDIVYSAQLLDLLIRDKHNISVPIDIHWKDYWMSRFENPLEDVESLQLTDDGNIKTIGQKVSNVEEIEGQYMGIVKLSQSGSLLFKNYLEKCFKEGYIGNTQIRNAYLTDLMHELSQQTDIYGLKNKWPWIEIDNCKDLKGDYTIRRLEKICLGIN